ncbi:DUF2167 domain-containing protein [Mucilaginibacter aquatilis]|uniref:DUF2167 domain-containing protein n=1 Tax=Mucilaginibacter aquatilis TaxID=1517760 RepID=A0A6I4I3S4_9SPHI|nr:DUF2167 domain-containing protein [Mucilaginibacter aquatilis]MVN89785.1 DUF2167 domain-containing protein [Mucilaginibacter aquatilis]
MIKSFFSLLLVLFTGVSFAQNQSRIDSVEKLFTYQHGTIKLRNGIGTITVPKGFKYLEPVQAERVLTEIWHNPKSQNMSLGFILPEEQGILADHGYVFNLEYDEIGYVKDDDADEIDYDELLTNMQKETEETNAERVKQGYPPISLVGWAAKPYYDANRHILHWAKNIKFGNDSLNTLNYNVRILGRKGVLVLNAIATMNDLNMVKAGIPNVLNIVNFSEGFKYTDFDPKIDNVAAWTIGGLVAGKILAKVGFFALMLKFWKVLAFGVVAAFSFIKKKLFGKKEEEVPLLQEPDNGAADDDESKKEPANNTNENSERPKGEID